MLDLRTMLSKFLLYHFVLAEAKLIEVFPNSQFVIDQYEIQTRWDRIKNGGGGGGEGGIEYVRKGLIWKHLGDIINLNSETTLPEITVRNNKWTSFSAHRSPCNSNIKSFLGDLPNLLNKYLSKYDNDVIMGDFDIDWKDKMNPNFDNFFRFCDICSMSNRIKDYTCFTKTHKSSIDLILTNKEHSFQLAKTTETGVTDVHLLLLIFMKSETTHLPPKHVMYRDLENFNEKAFLDDVKLNNFSRKCDDSNENYEFLS